MVIVNSSFNLITIMFFIWYDTGKVATHALVYAQLLIDGREYGVHSFLIQIRDEAHRPLPGIELGDLGTKMGDGANDTGTYCSVCIYIVRWFTSKSR